MRYSTETRFRRYVKGYDFLSFAKTAPKRVVQKTAEATGDLIGNKVADNITSIGKAKEKEKTKEIEKFYIPPEKRQQIIDDLRLF